MIETSSIIALFAFFLGMGLCLWRFNEADRWHAALCGIAAILWAGMFLFEPAIRKAGFFLGTAFILLFTLGQCFRRSTVVRSSSSD